MCKVIAQSLTNFPVCSGCLSGHYKLTDWTDWLDWTDWTDWRLWINSGVCDGVAMAFTFGVPSDILIWLHFLSQATVPFVLEGVCWRCVNLFISDGAKTALIGGPVDLRGRGMKFSIKPSKISRVKSMTYLCANPSDGWQREKSGSIITRQLNLIELLIFIDWYAKFGGRLSGKRQIPGDKYSQEHYQQH